MTAKNYLTYLHLLTPLHTGGSADEGNLMGIAREVHTEFPYLPSSSLRGKIRAELEQGETKDAAGHFFGQKIKDGNQPTEGEVWFADATLLLFPIASLSHHIIWITCPLWLDRWSRWLEADGTSIRDLAKECRKHISGENSPKAAITNSPYDSLYLQTALLKSDDMEQIDCNVILKALEQIIETGGFLSQLNERLIILSDEDCLALIEMGLQREVRVALHDNEKTVKDGSFRSEEAVPPEAVLFFPWGVKADRPFHIGNKKDKAEIELEQIRYQEKLETKNETVDKLQEILKYRLQFGGLEGLGRGWTNLSTVQTSREK